MFNRILIKIDKKIIKQLLYIIKLLMDSLSVDILCYISIFLKDKDKLSLVACNTSFCLLSSKFIFNTSYIKIDKIKSLSYYDSFEKVILNNFFVENYLNSQCVLLYGKKQKIKIELPEKCRHIILTSDINEENIDNLLSRIPLSILSLELPSSYKKLLNNLPESIKYLRLNHYYNKPLNNLPKSLTHLFLGYNYNQYLDNLPESLIHLKLGGCYNKLLNNLPKSLTHLFLGLYYNQYLDNLPESLIHLELGSTYNKPLNNLPKSLTTLDGYSYQEKLIPNGSNFVNTMYHKKMKL
jgi:hypothetical protein